MDWIAVTDRLPPFGKNVLACSRLTVTTHVAFVSPVDGKLHQSFGGMMIQNFGRLRQKCLEQNWFTSIEYAKPKIEAWRVD
jgi:hypothetical protein